MKLSNAVPGRRGVAARYLLGILMAFAPVAASLADPNLGCRILSGDAECKVDHGPWWSTFGDAWGTSGPDCNTMNAYGGGRCELEGEAWDVFRSKSVQVYNNCQPPGKTDGTPYETIAYGLGIPQTINHKYNVTHYKWVAPNVCGVDPNWPQITGTGSASREVFCAPTFVQDAQTNTCVRQKAEACPAGNPIQCAGGQKMQTESDIARTSGSLLEFVRYYSSTGFYASLGTDISREILGSNWRHSWQSNVVVESAAPPSTLKLAYVVRPNGDYRHFSFTNGVWVGRKDKSEALEEVTDQGQTIGWRYVGADDTVEIFDAAGRLISVTAKSGRSALLSYSEGPIVDVAPKAGLLIRVTDDSGRSIEFRYDIHAKLVKVLDASGAQHGYRYDVKDRLTFVDRPDATVREYRYNETGFVSAPSTPWELMTGIIDENAKRFATFKYNSSGRANQEWHGPGSADKLSLLYSGNYTTQTSSTLLTDALGATIRRKFISVNGILRDAGTDRCADVNCFTVTQSTSTTYDVNGNRDLVTDFKGSITDYAYDTRGLETQRIEAKNDTATPSSKRTVDTVWNAGFRVPDQRSVTNAAGVVESLTKWAYNARGQVVAKCMIDTGDAAAMAYACSATTEPPANAKVRRTTYSYCDAIGAGCPTVGLLLSMDGPRTDVSDITTYSYYTSDDESGCATLGGACHRKGDLWTVTNALGQVSESVTYDKVGRVTRSKDANGTLTDFTYHVRGWLLTRTVRANASGTPDAANDATTTFSYDNVGQVMRVTQPDGAYLNYTYDDAHRLTDITDNFSNRLHYTLDDAGNRTKEETFDVSYNPGVPGQGLKRSLSRVYNQLNRLVQSKNAALQLTRDSTGASFNTGGLNDGYDANGNAVLSQDGLNVQTKQIYDPLNRLASTIQDYLSNASTHDATTVYKYDARDNLIKVTDPEALDTTYTYDGLNNLTLLHSPDTGDASYEYDLAGNRTKQTDARSTAANYTYDVMNRLTGITYPTSSLNVTFSYDQADSITGCVSSFPLGRLSKITDSSGSTVYCYDRRGNVTRKTQISGTSTVMASLVTGYAYNNADRLATLTYPSGAIVDYTRNAIGQITEVKYKANAGATQVTVLSGTSYLPYGPLTSVTFGNGRTLSKTYDTNYQIDAVNDPLAGGLVLDFTPDVMGNITSASSAIGGAATRKYKYDNLYRLNEVDTGADALVEGFGYNKTGDRTSKTLAGQSPQVYGYLTNTHRLGSVAGVARNYDANGNTTARGSQIFNYDDRNRLSNAPADASRGATYGYNGRGERVTKLRYAPQGPGPENCSILDVFGYDERGQLLSEYSSGGINPLACGGSQKGLRAASSAQGAADARRAIAGVSDTQTSVVVQPNSQGGIPMPVAAADYLYLDSTPVAMVRDGVLYYVETDHLGTPRVAVNSSNNVAVWGWDFFGSAFGEHAQSGALLMNLRYPGQHFDSETSLSYNYFRDYESGAGRYVESDPIGLNGGLTTYSYVASSPTNGIDPFGLDRTICVPMSDPTLNPNCYNIPEPPNRFTPNIFPNPRPLPGFWQCSSRCVESVTPFPIQFGLTIHGAAAAAAARLLQQCAVRTALVSSGEASAYGMASLVAGCALECSIKPLRGTYSDGPVHYWPDWVYGE